MKDIVLDGAARRLPYLYYSSRTILFLCILASMIMWIGTGFDIEEGNVPIIGIQWSSFLTFSVFFYAMIVNLQAGGLKTISQLFDAFKYDARITFSNPFRFKRSEYKFLTGVVDPARALAVSFFFCIASLFVFENVWVLLYNYFQFGNWLWPVYYANGNGSIWTTYIFQRNVFTLISSITLASVTLYVAMEGSGESIKSRFKVKWRFDACWIGILLLTIYVWGLWIILPHNANQIYQTGFIFPFEQWFPQTTYTYYPASAYLQDYKITEIRGFFIGDLWVHLLNVTAKFFTFLLVCYPAMARVKLNK